LVIFFLTVFFRVPNLSEIPRWDWDEGANLDMTLHLMEGRAQWFALRFPYVPHPPLFFIVSSLFIKFFGPSILTLRMLAVTLSVATTILIYCLGVKLFDERTGFLAGVLYAVYPVAVYWGRMGLANNLLVFLSVSSMYLFQCFLERRDYRLLYSSALLAGLCFVTGFAGLSALLAVLFLTFKYAREKIHYSLTFSLAAPAAFIAYELYSMPVFFITEVLFQLERFNFTFTKLAFVLIAVFLIYLLRKFFKTIADSMRSAMTEIPILGLIFMSFFALFMFPLSDSGYHLAFSDYLTYVFSLGFAVKPLFFVESGEKKNLVLSYFFFYFMFLLAVDRADHMSMVSYPYLPLLASSFFLKLFGDVKSFFSGRMVRYAALSACILVFHPVFISASHSAGIAFGLTVVRQDVPSVLSVVDYVGRMVSEDSVVLGYSWMTHLIDSKFCVVGQSAAYDGHEVAYYSGDYPDLRWAFNCSFRNADLIILTDGSVGVMEAYPGFGELLDGISTWEKVYVSVFGVYHNPEKHFLRN